MNLKKNIKFSKTQEEEVKKIYKWKIIILLDTKTDYEWRNKQTTRNILNRRMLKPKTNWENKKHMRWKLKPKLLKPTTRTTITTTTKQPRKTKRKTRTWATTTKKRKRNRREINIIEYKRIIKDIEKT